MSTPPAPTDAEMIAWLECYAEGYRQYSSEDADMAEAIAARLRAPSAGKSEPQPAWQGEDA